MTLIGSDSNFSEDAVCVVAELVVVAVALDIGLHGMSSSEDDVLLSRSSRSKSNSKFEYQLLETMVVWTDCAE